MASFFCICKVIRFLKCGPWGLALPVLEVLSPDPKGVRLTVLW